MKKIIQLLKDHWKEDFSLAYYITIAAYLAALIGLNQVFEIEQNFDRANGQPIRIVYYLILYSLTYVGACLIVFYFKGRPGKKFHLRFARMAAFGLVVLSVSAGFPYTVSIMQWIGYDSLYYVWFFQVLNNFLGLIRVFIPLLTFSYLFMINKKEWLGLNNQQIEWKPFFLLLALVAPLVIVASFEQEFRNYYPTFQRFAPNDPNANSIISAGVYELSYAFDFVNVELLFRGFFVIGLSMLIGRNAVVPMVALYCALHFGKPLGEIVSSIFGGYILGVIAFRTRSIWGGIIIHIGLAWMMEIAAYVQRL